MQKRWLVGLGVLLMAATLLLPPLAADVDCILRRELEDLTWKPWEGWAAVLQGGKAMRFYLLGCAGVVLALAWVLFTGSYLKYRSNMQQITPDIFTPQADGQGQFGTARWLPKKRFGKVFAIWQISKEDPALQALLEAGRQDRKEIANAQIQIKTRRE
ncbi:MAG TPA: hypothetical protein IAC31_02295 [Candidatus Faecousia intestinigallinarum]|nr:hypothetical protein [Candidatus Faecousia intestinigallinarum]